MPELEGRLTREQQVAVQSVEQSACVVAGAGTGKTHVLTERILHLIEQESVDPKQVAAITFTEKAAKEMQARLKTRLPEVDFSSNVSTIHSFCFRLLREFHVAAGLPQDITVASEMVSYALKLEALEEVVFSWQQARSDELTKLVQGVAWQGAGDSLAQLANTLLPFYSRLCATGWSGDQEFFSGYSSKALANQRQKLCRELATLSEQVDKQPKANALKEANQAVSAGRLDGDLKQAIASVRDIDVLLGGRWREDLRETRDMARVEAKLLLSMLYQNAAKPYYQCLRHFLNDFNRAYLGLKRSEAILDFDDLQQQTLLLLQKQNEVQRQLSERFVHLLIDEFQDVSPLQRELVEALRRDQKVGSLFLVGDVRQSIYAFRYADIHGFTEMSRSLQKAGGLRLALTENFRSNQAIIALLNDYVKTHEKKMAEGEELGDPLRATASFAEGESAVSCHFYYAPNSEAAHKEEASHLARRIRELVDSKRTLITDKSSERFGEPLDYGDIALLVRHRSSIAAFRDAFSQANIPMFAQATGGFYDRREVQDLLATLKVAVDPTDDLAFAGVLKSPLVGLSDRALFHLATASQAKGLSLCEAFLETSHDDLSSEESGKSKRAALWIDELTTKSAHRLVYPLLETIVLKSGIEESPSLKERDQTLANINKLLQLALTWDRQSGRGVQGFLRMSDMLHRGASKEPQAELPTTRGRVSLMTVHAAKGLEFPIVCIGDLRRRGNIVAPPLVCDRQGSVGLRMRDDAFEGVSTKAHLDVSATLRTAAEAEELRIFYVALSRAKQQLMLSSGVTQRDSGWLKALAKQFPLDDQLNAEQPTTEEKEIPSFSGHVKLKLYTQLSSQS